MAKGPRLRERRRLQSVTVTTLLTPGSSTSLSSTSDGNTSLRQHPPRLKIRNRLDACYLLTSPPVEDWFRGSTPPKRALSPSRSRSSPTASPERVHHGTYPRPSSIAVRRIETWQGVANVMGFGPQTQKRGSNQRKARDIKEIPPRGDPNPPHFHVIQARRQRPDQLLQHRRSVRLRQDRRPTLHASVIPGYHAHSRSIVQGPDRQRNTSDFEPMEEPPTRLPDPTPTPDHGRSMR